MDQVAEAPNYFSESSVVEIVGRLLRTHSNISHSSALGCILVYPVLSSLHRMKFRLF